MKNRQLVGWLWKTIRGSRGRIVINCVIGVLRIILSLAFVYTCKHIVDIATGMTAGDLPVWMGFMVAMILLQQLTTLVNTRVRERNRIELTNQLQKRIFRQAMNSRWTGRDRLHTGDTMSRLGEDVRSVSVAVSEHLPMLVLAIVQLVAGSVVLFMLGRELLWVLLIIMPLAVIVSKIYYKKLRSLTDQVRKQEGDLQSHMQENLLKRLLIICMGGIDASVNTLAGRQNTLKETVIERINYSSRAHLFIQMGFMAGYCVTFCWGAFGIMAGTVTYGMMTAFLQLVNQVQVPIVNMSHYLPSLVQSFSSIERLYIIDNQPQIQNIDCESHICTNGKEETKLKDSVPIGLRIENLSFTYPDGNDAVIDHLNYDFHPGKHFAITGPTGQGKSTLIRLLLGLLQPAEGRVILYDTEGNEMPMSDSLRREFCYVPQGNSLMSGTVRDNLRMARQDATDEEMRQVLHLAAADFVLEREEGLDTSCAEQGNGLSEGQAQRIAIARALLQPGRIMLFDEACSALDSETESIILNNLLPLLSSRTILWITHDESVEKRMEKTLKL